MARPFPTIAEFLFNSPLYEQLDVTKSLGDISLLASGQYRVDGWCKYCNRETTFSCSSGYLVRREDIQPLDEFAIKLGSLISLRCARNDGHSLYFYVTAARGKLWKVGQYPSLADIANDESKSYASVLDEVDKSEFHKAIGLAAHGVGIGSFVYLRRIFERLVQGRFDQHKEAEGWNAEAFFQLRMVERVGLLKQYLPPFLVENKNIYAVLSKGIHELTEEECLGYFNVLKMSIITILREDRRKKEDDAQKEVLAKTLKGIGGKPQQASQPATPTSKKNAEGAG